MSLPVTLRKASYHTRSPSHTHTQTHISPPVCQVSRRTAGRQHLWLAVTAPALRETPRQASPSPVLTDYQCARSDNPTCENSTVRRRSSAEKRSAGAHTAANRGERGSRTGSRERVSPQRPPTVWGSVRPSGLQPMEVYVDDEAKLTLHGLQQHYCKVKENEKNRKLFELLDVLEFNQVVIFVKSIQRCMALAKLLIEQNFPAIAIHRSMSQEERLSKYQQFKDFQKRILVATNLFGRGMDIERVNIVFNYDMPEDSDTYLHRVARAGRFGTKGLAITFISDEANAKILNDVQDRFDVNITELPDEIDLSSYIEGR